ncbi:MAG: glycosyltransferase [Candidatus Aquicultorales bacterium]
MIIYAIPAYNEEQDLERLVESIAGAMDDARLEYRVIVVDDGSTDATPRIVEDLSKRLPVACLTNERNLGLGKTLRRALKQAAEEAAPDDVIVTMDGDATHDPAYVPALAKRVAEGADVVIASRFADGGEAKGVAVHRKILSGGAGVLLKIFFPIKGVRDYTSGFRAYRASILQKAFGELGDAFLTESGFSVSPEIILELSKLGATIQEEPFILRYDLKSGESKINILRTIRQYVSMMVRLRVKSR